MHHLTLLTTLAFSLTVPVFSLVVPRATPPKGYLVDRLEPYDTYHTRYMALACNTKHSTKFFDQCCHPLLANEKLSARPAQCTPPNVNTSVGSNDDDDDLPFCDDNDDDNTTPHSTTPTPAAPKPTPTPTAARQQAPSAPAPVATPPSGNSAASSVQTGGFATFFYQNGVAGACGTVHKDTDLIAAIDGDRYGNLGARSSLCGKKVKITNPKNQKSVTVTIADACPTCKNSNSIDLSVSAFKNIATLDEGMVGITWSFV
ncbi:hypothetical protein M413DRAFT_15265 [Hebeloma cylindrosporum]|uniref:RlpA-like protein double-psi beta-barrel domain-containing protein n=1 Tax=Hebeloma cylindrosporum TaxID=76867 RepID=A0A0C3CK22_HEBCY|nr:hypothetical protein M413DRAFT_15265 [Hebeloma cylindrosporum h7]